MTEPLAKIAMNQIRKNMLFELIQRAATSARHRQEFYEFIAKEPVAIDKETVDFLIRDANLSVGVGQVFRPEIRSDLLVKPQFRSKSLSGLLSLVRQCLVYYGAKLFVKILAKVLVFHNETQAFLICSSQASFESKPVRDER